MNVSAEVVVTLRITNLGSWSPDCSSKQVFDQASEAAIKQIKNAFPDMSNMNVVGQPVVKTIMSEGK